MIPGIVASTRRGGGGGMDVILPLQPFIRIEAGTNLDGYYTETLGTAVDGDGKNITFDLEDYLTSTQINQIITSHPAALTLAVTYVIQSSSISASLFPSPTLPEDWSDIYYYVYYYARSPDQMTTKVEIDGTHLAFGGYKFDSAVSFGFEALDPKMSDEEWEKIDNILTGLRLSVYDSLREEWVESVIDEAGYWEGPSYLADEVENNPGQLTRLRITAKV